MTHPYSNDCTKANFKAKYKMTFGLSWFLLVTTLWTGKGCGASSTLTLSGHQDTTHDYN